MSVFKIENLFQRKLARDLLETWSQGTHVMSTAKWNWCPSKFNVYDDDWENKRSHLFLEFQKYQLTSF